MLFVLKGRVEEDIYEGEFGHLSLDLVNEGVDTPSFVIFWIVFIISSSIFCCNALESPINRL